MFDTPLFECTGGFYAPCLSHTADGTPREVDGVRVFTAGQVSALTGLDEAALREGHGITLNDCMSGSAAAASGVERALREKYAHLSDPHYAQFRQQCRRLRLSPWGRHVWARTLWSEQSGDNELVIELTADGFNAIAARTGELRQVIGPQWCGPDGKWTDVCVQETPYAARVGVLREGMTEPRYMVALWSDYAPYKFAGGGKKVYSEFWQRMPAFMLGKCAECVALRRAFADHLDGVYGPEELQRSWEKSEPAAVPGLARSAPTEPGPETPQQFRLALIDMGLGKAQQREAVIEGFRQRFRPLYTQNMLGWYEAVIREIRREPGVYGIETAIESTP